MWRRVVHVQPLNMERPSLGLRGRRGGGRASDEPQRNSKFLGAGQIVLLLTREKEEGFVRVVTSVL